MKTLLHYIQQAMVNLMAAKLRSILAVLGVLIGTAAVVTLLSCGRLATEKALAQFKALGTDLLSISVYPKSSGKNSGKTPEIPLSVWRSLPEQTPGIVGLAPYSTGYQPMSFAGKTLTGVIIGGDETLAKLMHIQLAQGHFVSFVETFEHFCVIGHDLAEQLHQVTLDNPIGKQIRLGSILYTIIGVAKPWKENGFFNEDINQAAIIPVAGMSLVSQGSAVNNAILLLKPGVNIDWVIERIKQILHTQAPELNIFVRSAKQIIASMESQGQIFTLLLAIIGSVALLVGGIGVMNVMLVSVSERKKEIGIRKAIGAKNRDIQILFLTESILLSLLGGSLGIFFGLLITWTIAYFSHWNFILYLTPPLAGFAVSVLTGIFFGFYPARRAALLDPVVSLRNE